ncbi:MULTISPECIES: restriction endonuclease subunit S [unclassified Acinetobacter]|uniref:restriction endonuclease subunit S n=1 Tax=unclassified Acinetobacter TaxID=196816 RepID=UPI0018A93F8B|nr:MULTISPECIES: restriction endonuclease subunit S [unclassified Acinetobacter]MBJ9954874.1 restriction endonuclease subunit S [Acinetobacter baumannii]
MNFLENLLDGVEVEWKAVSEIFHLKNGYTPSTSKKELWENGSIPWFRMDDIREKGQILDDSLQKISESAVKSGKLFPANSIIISTSATIGEHALITVPYLANQRFTNLSLKDSYAKVFDMKFIFYYCFLLADWCKKNTTMSSFASVDMDGFRKFKIAIPCPENPKKSLEIQAEIVRILDAFSAITAELTAELNIRKKQYNYYRDHLLNFEYGQVEWKVLGELAENLDSKRKPITSGLRDVGDIPYYGASGIVDYVKNYIFDGDFLLVSEDGANLLARNTPIAFSISGKTWVNNHAHVLKFDTYAERRYVEYYLNSIDLTPYISGAAQPKLNKKNLESIRIPNPSLNEKKRIVTILDKFDALINSTSEGLLGEIELRQQQYEYYRDLLLSFPKNHTEVVV